MKFGRMTDNGIGKNSSNLEQVTDHDPDLGSGRNTFGFKTIICSSYGR